MRTRQVRALAAIAATATACMMFCAAPSQADPPPPGCERVPILGLNPQIREICDLPMQPDGSWTRFRSFSHPEFVHSSCGGIYYDGGQWCPYWNPYRDTVPAEQGPVEQYVVTVDTIPPGEPGYIGG